MKAPVNYYLYKEGYTLTGWNDGTTTYNVGDEITPEADMTLTAVYTANEVELADREAAVTINFVLNGYNENPQYKFEGITGVMVTQATVNGKSIDVAANVDATSGKFAANGTGWHQVNTGTKVTVPSAKEATISVSTYNDGTGTSMTFNGEQGTGNNVITYTATAEDATCEIEQVSSNYWNSLTIILPVVSGEDPDPFPLTEDVTATWDFSDSDVMAATMALSGTSTPGKVDDVAKDGIKMTVEANGATFRNNNGTNIQVRTGAVFKVPVQSTDDVVTVNGYPNYSFYAIGNNTTVLNDVNTYKAKLADVEQGYVAITSMSDNNYYYSISVDLKAPKEPVTLDNEPVTATFPFHEGTEKQTAEFGDDAAYFLSSKVTHGDALTITGKRTPNDLESPVETLFQPRQPRLMQSSSSLFRSRDSVSLRQA